MHVLSRHIAIMADNARRRGDGAPMVVAPACILCWGVVIMWVMG